MESLLFDLDDEDDKFVIDNLATLIVLTHLVITGKIEAVQVKKEGNVSTS